MKLETSSSRPNMNSTHEKKTKPDMATISKTYKYIGCANSSSFEYPEDAEWMLCKTNGRGTYEVFCCHRLKIYYDVYSD
jgi:hypothetical protein